GAGLVSAGSVGDLHVGDAVGVGGAGGVDVVAVDAQVEDVEEEADVSLPGAVDRRDRVRGGLERIGGRARDGLDEHGAVDSGHGLGGEREVLGAELVLGGGGGVVDPVAVQGVEGAAAGQLADAGDRVEVV